MAYGRYDICRLTQPHPSVRQHVMFVFLIDSGRRGSSLVHQLLARVPSRRRALEPSSIALLDPSLADQLRRRGYR
jgi:hypothetical protein